MQISLVFHGQSRLACARSEIVAQHKKIVNQDGMASFPRRKLGVLGLKYVSDDAFSDEVL